MCVNNYFNNEAAKQGYEPHINEDDTENREPICTNPYHIMPVIPKSGSMTFEYNNADDALATLKALLSNSKVNLTVCWQVVENEGVGQKCE